MMGRSIRRVALALLLWASPLAQAETPSALQPFVGVWHMDWDRSEGMHEMMVAQGIPGFMVSMVRGRTMEQRWAVVDGQLHMTLKLPVGSTQEVWSLDGQWREQKSRLGKHQLKATLEDGKLTVVRTFSKYTLTEVYRRDGAVMVSTRTLVKNGQTHVATRILTEASREDAAGD